ncbi:MULTISPECIES: aminodeoxychorismate/anthranilate synthase component II [unclassified Anaerobiospirillum]|uniref:anthranilate synthase component II n=1 Tax=unclassified Anaerobiospirillum TaxID=2647410 RepID=UPI001FF33592|nr:MULTISPECIES: aminodeoxychorismate/anthranilate synthase component II [unclassified Anaerobiospirillum]MCK0534905.1 aminodeoxychorismate/anthranilate synthase component II [Anaerobiospirillum sp. NML120511]MCK0540087.1 aminodeoxychorismate/anthranilate synthase component II [Anaerobiospirillum sp. NML02-A-032]
MILLIDNYDSFSYNLYQLTGEINPDIKVIRNDELTVEQIAELRPERIIISPGPGRPEDAGIIMQVPKALGASIPVLGVCLGHQAICAAFGATVTYARQLMHGKQSEVSFYTSCPLFKDVPERAPVARYHSLAVDPDTLPPELKVTAVTDSGEVMAIAHSSLPVFGVQFHPESIMTPDGSTMLKNFLTL